MIEKTQVANLHGFHIIAGLIVAHPVPAFPDIALFQLILPDQVFGSDLKANMPYAFAPEWVF